MRGPSGSFECKHMAALRVADTVRCEGAGSCSPRVLDRKLCCACQVCDRWENALARIGAWGVQQGLLGLLR